MYAVYIFAHPCNTTNASTIITQYTATKAEQTKISKGLICNNLVVSLVVCKKFLKRNKLRNYLSLLSKRATVASFLKFIKSILKSLIILAM